MARGARGGKTGQGRANQGPKTKGAKGALKGRASISCCSFGTFWDFVVYLERGLEPAFFNYSLIKTCHSGVFSGALGACGLRREWLG